MKIEFFASVKSLWFMNMLSLNPRGRNIEKPVAACLKAWYGFEDPVLGEDKGRTFKNGEFSPTDNNNDLIGMELKWYSDGLVAIATTKTEDTELFLERTLTRLTKEGLIVYRPEIVTEKRYASEVVARADRPLMEFPQLASVYELFSKFVYPTNAAKPCVVGLALDLDPGEARRQVIPLKFERRANTSKSENLYYSHAPVKSSQHQILLDELEKALSAS